MLLWNILGLHRALVFDNVNYASGVAGSEVVFTDGNMRCVHGVREVSFLVCILPYLMRVKSALSPSRLVSSK